jgi:Signal transduction histidine kinase
MMGKHPPKARTRRQPSKPLDKYRDLAQIGYAINSELETIEDLFQKLYLNLRDIVDTSYCLMLAVYQPQNDSLDYHLIEAGNSRIVEGSALDGGCRWVMEEQKPLLINQFSKQHADLPVELIEIPGGTLPDPESVVFIPLVLRGVSLGVLSVQSQRKNAYDSADIAVLELVANHVALALSNLRLFHSLLSINETGQLLTKQLDSWKVPQNIVDQIRSVTRADLVVLYPYDQATQDFQFPRCVSGMLRDEDFPEPRYSRNDDVARLVLNRGEPVFAKNTSRLFSELDTGDVGTRKGNFEVREAVRSTAALPLLVRDEPVGILFVNYRRSQRFDDPQKQLIQALAHHAAIAIKNIREYGEQTNNYIRRLELLQELENEIGKTLDLKEILGTILKLATRLIKADDASILLYNPRTKSLEAKAALGRNIELRQNQVIRIDETTRITLASFKEQRPIRVDNVNTDPQWKDLYYQISSDVISELDIPLVDQGEGLGVINMESTVPAAFDQVDVQLLNALAIRAVLALKNAQAYERQRRISKELEAMFVLSEQIINQLDVKEICQSILEKALEITDAIAGNLMLFDSKENDLEMVAQRGVAEHRKNYRQQIGEGVVGEVAKQKQLLNVPDVLDRRWSHDYVALIDGTRSELAVPIYERERLWGVINIESHEPHHFGQGDEQLLSALADMAVIAFQNAERFRRVANNEAQLAALRDIDQRIISQFEDPDQVMRAILEGAVILNACERGYLHLCEQGMVKTKYVAQCTRDGGISVEKIDYPKGEPLRGIVEHVAETRELYRPTRDAQSDPFYDGDKNMHSVVAVPLILNLGELRKELIGIVSLQSSSHEAFDSDSEGLLKMFAAQAVIAIRSARDYSRAEREAQRFSQLYGTAWELAHITEVNRLDQAYDIVMGRADSQNESQIIVTRYSEDDKELELVRSLRVQGELKFRKINVTEGINGLVARTKEPVVIYDMSQSELEIVPLQPIEESIRSLVVVPLEFEDKYYGNLALSHVRPNYFKGADVELIRGLAKQLAITIHRLETVQARRDAEQRVKEVEVMSSIGQSTFELSHRLGNDLGLIKSYVNNIRSTVKANNLPLPDEADEYLNKIVTDVGGVLTLSKRLKQELQEDAQETLRPEIITVDNLLHEIARCNPNLPSSIKVNVEVDGQVGAVEAILDQVKNTLRNLFFNAVEAMPKGGSITLRACNSGEHVNIDIEDTGIGIPLERQHRVFDLFYSTKGSFGFGLWSSRRNALKNGGDLKVRSHLGIGSVFTLSLPRARTGREHRI